MADRSTYRTLENDRLIEEAKYNPNRELAIVLGERLQDFEGETDARVGEALERVRDITIDANRLDDKVYRQGVEIDKLETILECKNDEIRELKEQLAKLKGK